MRAAALQAPGRLELVDLPEPEAGARDVVVQVAAAGICGSDITSFRTGAYVRPGQVMGHEFAGTVVAAGSAVSGLAVGDAVTAMPLHSCQVCRRCTDGEPHVCERALASGIGYGLPGAFAERVRVPDAVLGRNLFLLPDSVDAVSAAGIEPLAVAVHALSGTALRPQDAAVVLGLGPIGLNVVQVLRARGTGTVVAVDLSARRRELASALGADVVLGAQGDELVAAVAAVTGAGPRGRGAYADLVVEATGAAVLVDAALDLLRPGGELRLAALYSVPTSLRADIVVTRELRVGGAFGYRPADFAAAVALVAGGRARPASLVSHEFPLEDAPSAMQAQLDRDAAVKVVLRP